MFQPIQLAKADRLLTDIELVLCYRGHVPSEIFSSGFHNALRVFPHLLGSLSGLESIESAARDFVLECQSMSGSFAVSDFEDMPLARQSLHFIPEKNRTSLFAARCTHVVDAGMTVLGIRVSHAAVDGTGLALFFMHATAAIRGIPAPEVYHQRQHSFGHEQAENRANPRGYSHDDATSLEDENAKIEPVVFAIDVDVAAAIFRTSSLQDNKLTLASWLSAALRSHYEEVALWCDARGLNGIPASYTGNVGCYLHEPLGEAIDLKARLKAITTRKGFQRIAEIHGQIAHAERTGTILHWQCLRERVLQLNIVPHVIDGTDFGRGFPVYAMLLSRNSSGLRISLTPDTTRFLIEACIPGDLADELREKAHRHGLHPRIWCRGAL